MKPGRNLSLPVFVQEYRENATELLITAMPWLPGLQAGQTVLMLDGRRVHITIVDNLVRIDVLQ